MYLDRRLFEFTKGVRLRIMLVALIGIVAVPVGIWRLVATGRAIAQVLQGHDIQSIAPALALIAVLILLRAALQFVREEIGNQTAARMKVALRRRLYGHVVELGPIQLDQQRTGGVVLAMVDGVEQMDTIFGQYLPQLIVAALTPVIIFAFMAFLDVRTALIFLLFALFTLLAPAALHRWNAASSQMRRIAYSALGSDLLDSIQGLPTLKALGQSGRRGALLADRAHAVFRSTMYVLAVNIATGGITMLGISAGAAVALAWGAVRVHDGSLQLSTLLVVLLLGVEVFRPLRDLTQLYHKGMTALAAARGIYDVLDAVPEVQDAPQAEAPAAIEPSVRFEHVTFGYNGGRRPALRDVSFELRSGETLGVVGPSGAGKSTLVNLLLRFADPQQGRVLLGGHDVRELPAQFIQSQVSLVAQDVYLFHGTVAENLRLGKPDASNAELERAARVANAHEFIAALPRGYDTIVGERGTRLSGGQRARLAIARALLKDAPILVLDEALSSVDAENEAVIQQALERLQRGRTTLVIAHRLSSVINADRTIVVDRGRLVEAGTHATLMQQDGVYRRLMVAQQSVDSDRPIDGSRLVAANGAAAVVEEAEEILPPMQEAAVAHVGVWRVWMRLLALVKPWAGEMTITFVSGLVNAAATIGLGVTGALLVRQVVLHRPLTPFLILLLALVPLSAVMTWFHTWIAHDLAFRLLAEMRIALYHLLDPLAPAYLQRRRSGDIVSTATGDVETVELFFAHTIAPLAVAVLVPGTVLLVMAVIAWPVALALAPFLAGVALTPLIAGRAMERLGSELRAETGATNAYMVDSVQGLRTLIAFDGGPARVQEVTERSWAFYRLFARFVRDQALQNAIIETLTGWGALMVVAVGAVLVTQGHLARTILPLLTMLAVASFGPITEIVRTLKELAQTLASAQRFFAIEDEPVTVLDGPGVAAVAQPTTTAHPAGSENAGVTGLPVSFEQVVFSYGAGERTVIRDVSFAAAPGQTVALVGRSGAGKTTLAHLLLRFWDPQQGRITIDGQDLRAYTLDELRGLVTLVAQDTYLFNGTLRDNLLLARPEASEGELLEAARLANVAEFAEQLPDGYATQVGERGLQLSGGQRQRVAIARALLRDAPVLVLDEATSHLDAVNEAEVREALNRLMVGRTTVVIAHRLSTVRNADRIVVLDAGRVVEEGSHMELVMRDGLYSHLIASQLMRERTSEAEPTGSVAAG